MDVVTRYRDELCFECCPANYIMGDGINPGGPVGPIGYTGCCFGLNDIPDSMRFSIYSKNGTNKEILESIYDALVPIIDDKCLIEIRRTYDAYYKKLEEFETLFDNDERKIINMAADLGPDVFQFLIMPDQLRRRYEVLKQQLRFVTPSIFIYCKSGTPTYELLVNAKLLDKNKYRYPNSW